MQSAAATVDEYLRCLQGGRREALSSVREEILKVLQPGFEEAVNWGMICYQVPLALYPDTYNRQPLLLCALASQKNHMSLYLTTPYVFVEEEKAIREAYAAAGRKLDMGKSCIRFKDLDGLLLGPILDTIQGTSTGRLIEAYQASHPAK